MTTSTLRTVGIVVLCLLLVVGSGCLTVQPSVRLDGGDGVFESISTTDEWGTTSIQTTVTLTRTATTDRGVTKLTVITESGSSFYSTTVDGGQTKVAVPLPTDQVASIYAVNTVNGTIVGSENVTVGGRTLP